MLIVRGLTGKEEGVSDYTGIERKRTVNGEKTLSFSVRKTRRNEHSFNLVQPESFIEYDDVVYRIKNLRDTLIGKTPKKEVTAVHIFFDIIDLRQEAILTTGEKTINEVMSFIFSPTPYNFVVIDAFDTVYLENFGNANCLSLFNTALERFEAEFSIQGYTVTIRDKIGVKSTEQLRFGYNIKTLDCTHDTNNLSTYVKGYGKEREEKDILKGESKNLQTRTGTWEDTSDPYWYTKDVGASFQMQWYGTGIRFWYLADNTGGVWDLTLDKDQTFTLSTWASSPQLKSVDLFRDAEQASHTIVAIFKGDDPKNTPSTGKGTAKGWVRYSDTNNLKTFETYRLREGDERYSCVVEYTSPNEKKFGLRKADPIYDDRITNPSTLLAKVEKSIIDEPEVSFSLEYIEMQKQGFNVPLDEGDTVPTIYEPLDVDLDLRVIEITDYPESNKSPVLTLSNKKDNVVDVTFNYAKQLLDQIWNENSKKMKYDVLPEATKLATAALLKAQTELKFENGIVAVSKTNPNLVVVINSAGLGVSTNGGETFENAITAFGVNTNLLTAGRINTNNIAIVGDEAFFYWDGNEFLSMDPNDRKKYVKITPGFIDIGGGAIRIKRPDGADFILNGIPQYDFTVQGMTPQFCSPEVTVAPRSSYTNATDAKDFQAYVFRHQGRYLRVNVSLYQTGGGTGYMSVEQSYEGFAGWKRWALVSSTVTSSDANSENSGREMLIDLGIPTGDRKLIYVRIWSSNANTTAYGRVTGIWQEG
ncbi:hypothetical protein COJ01_11905 [Priestia megaterium]|uniref:prophage endopeptidase tail family protein n=1 Tax=Priestia megaterium TaxID=1404 RepID=UPI000BF62DF5|nr:prophage endopeptidase tail family protein [Priestia megaterium]PFL01159.1 hypothetical protein COJ01_11905 [Priestia megaterium]